MSGNGLTDLVTAARFLTRLTDGEPVTFQTFADSSDGRHLACILHGTLADHGNALQALNQAGAAVFLMVNAGDGLGRKAENVVRVRALFADLDGAPLAAVLVAQPEPHLIIESSPRRYHAYWLVKDCALDRFTPLQAATATIFASDPKVKDLPRVMRLPGYWHQKAEPFQTRIQAENTVAPYTVAELEDGLGLLAAATALPAIPIAVSPAPTFAAAAGTVSEGSRNARLTSLAGTMRRHGMSTDAIHAGLQQENATRCQPARDMDHLKAAREVIKSFGTGNLLDASGYLWRWRGDGVWRRINDREIKQKIHDVTANNELTAPVVNSVLDMVKTEAHQPSHRFDENPQNFNCANGELDYQNGRWVLLPHERELREWNRRAV